jgi:Rad3-related DNA helicase
MEFDLDQRSAALGVGELAAFALGPRDAGDGPAGVWRAQLGTRWHQALRAQTAAATAAAEFEVAVAGRIFHEGWTLTLSGRIDQLVPAALAGGAACLREIKTTLRALPADEAELRADHPDYFAQLAAYVALARLAPDALPAAVAGGGPVRGELVFVEAGSGLAQTLALLPADDGLFRARLTAVVEFLNLRWRARERLRGLRFHPAFSALRAGQETTRADLEAALKAAPAVLFEAPTGFGKTGVLLECALERLRAGRCTRVVYLTGKSTGQLHVMQTLQAMTAPTAPATETEPNPVCNLIRYKPGGVEAWLVRPKREHCVNAVYQCTRETCGYLHELEARWPRSGLARFYLLENQPRDLSTLREAGRSARLCPYEITRAALAFNDVWVGDYNHVFAPDNRGVFYDQPGFAPEDTLLVIDEAHNLPARVADSHSRALRAEDLPPLAAELEHLSAPAPLMRAVHALAEMVAALPACDALDLAQEDDLGDTLEAAARQVAALPLDYAALGPHFAELLWEFVALDAWLSESGFPRLLWCPRAGELRFTCLDAAALIGETLRAYGGVIFATATPGPAEIFAEACGLGPSRANGDATQKPRPDGRGAVVLRPQPKDAEWAQQDCAPTPPSLARVIAHTPWREGAYDVAYDVRVDTTHRQRARHHATTAATVAALHAAARGPVAVFFPSYAYAEAVQRGVENAHPEIRAVRQPKSADLAAQAGWMESSLAFADALFLVLGSGFAEGIDLLGGRVTHAMVVGPALPEVNAVQKARLATLERAGLKRDAAFQRVYQVPGMQRVNQAVGRLVRAPGQKAKVLLHCRRFIEPSYAALLDPAYQFGATIADDGELAAWLAG